MGKIVLYFPPPTSHASTWCIMWIYVCIFHVVLCKSHVTYCKNKKRKKFISFDINHYTTTSYVFFTTMCNHINKSQTKCNICFDFMFLGLSNLIMEMVHLFTWMLPIYYETCDMIWNESNEDKILKNIHKKL
jgi:hypothetical protein